MSKKYEIKIAKDDEYYHVEIADSEGKDAFFQCRHENIEFIFCQAAKHFAALVKFKDEEYGKDWNKIEGWELWE